MSERHSFPVRIYYEDTDAAGIVYYANYLRYAERARTEWLRELGHAHRAMTDVDGLAFAVRRCLIDYLKPAMLDDLLSVESVVTHVKAASLDVIQDVMRGSDLLARLEIRLACLDNRLKPARMPDPLRNRLTEAMRG
ncbi:MAG: tol-pal system-associated acyl-CoA thioesterase [Rhodospirillales bacterium]|jgi:acyl-CoA thioester hydrolase|nr:tol-pal system-associated acyl-CoA thioesterase [Rhodospirillales bacterium]